MKASLVLLALGAASCRVPSTGAVPLLAARSIDADAGAVSDAGIDAGHHLAAWAGADAGYSAIWVSEGVSFVPSSTNYTLLAGKCDYQVADDGTVVRRYYRCGDRAFDACFRGCGLVYVDRAGVDWRAELPELEGCADECDRRIRPEDQ